jgi:hypothetical protein
VGPRSQNIHLSLYLTFIEICSTLPFLIEHQQRVADRITTVSDKLQQSASSGLGALRQSEGVSGKGGDIANCARSASELAVGQINGTVGQLIKRTAFVDIADPEAKMET